MATSPPDTTLAARLEAALEVLAPKHITREYRPADAAADEIRKLWREQQTVLGDEPSSPVAEAGEVETLRALAEAAIGSKWWLWDDEPRARYGEALAFAHEASPRRILALLARCVSLQQERDEALSHAGVDPSMERIRTAHSAMTSLDAETKRGWHLAYKQGHDERCYICTLAAAVELVGARAATAETALGQAQEALRRALYLAEHLHAMVPREVWRDRGGDDMQGHYEGDYHAEQVATEIQNWKALAGEPPGECNCPRDGDMNRVGVRIEPLDPCPVHAAGEPEGER